MVGGYWEEGLYEDDGDEGYMRMMEMRVNGFFVVVEEEEV